jgi:hypothetical protein
MTAVHAVWETIGNVLVDLVEVAECVPLRPDHEQQAEESALRRRRWM